MTAKNLETNPETLGWMQGFPPAKDKVIRFNDGSFTQWPELRWTFSHIQQLVPTKTVWRGAAASKRTSPRGFTHHTGKR
ncbi:MAG: hypothetical protein ACI9WS_003291 [Paraglaciecola psychrophila]|jgi:hypothetical protein